MTRREGIASHMAQSLPFPKAPWKPTIHSWDQSFWIPSGSPKSGGGGGGGTMGITVLGEPRVGETWTEGKLEERKWIFGGGTPCNLLPRGGREGGFILSWDHLPERQKGARSTSQGSNLGFMVALSAGRGQKKKLAPKQLESGAAAMPSSCLAPANNLRHGFTLPRTNFPSKGAAAPV